MNDETPSAVSLFDWSIYRHLFSAPGMEKIFGERATIEAWVEVEKAVARAQAAVGIMPPEAAETINAGLDAAGIDLERLRADTLDVGRPIVGMIKQLSEQVGAGADVWVHYGVTTYDVMDTGRVLQLRAGLDEINAALARYLAKLGELAAEHRDTVMIGRTNNLHAQPITLGGKLAVWIEEGMRHCERLAQARKRLLVVQFGGATGTLASLHPHGLAFRRRVADELGLGHALSNWHNARDGMTEVSLTLGNLCASLARNAQNINSLSSTEIGELSEAGGEGRGRSTAMAHKRNPRAAEFAEAVARLGRQRAMGLAEVMGQEHDRCGGTWIAEWMLVPETFLLASGALGWANDLLERLEVHPEKMRANVDMTGGLALTERFTLALASRISKFEARKILDAACAHVATEGGTLAEALKAMPDAREVMDADEIDALADPAGYVGAAPEIVDDVLKALAAKE